LKEQVAIESNVTFLNDFKKHLSFEKEKLYYRSKNTTSAKYAELETYINLIDARLKQLNLASGKKKRNTFRRKLFRKRKTVKKKGKI